MPPEVNARALLSGPALGALPVGAVPAVFGRTRGGTVVARDVSAPVAGSLLAPVAESEAEPVGEAAQVDRVGDAADGVADRPRDLTGALGAFPTGSISWEAAFSAARFASRRCSASAASYAAFLFSSCAAECLPDSSRDASEAPLPESPVPEAACAAAAEEEGEGEETTEDERRQQDSPRGGRARQAHGGRHDEGS